MKEKYLLVPKGRFDHPQGVQVIDDDAMRRIVDASVKRGRDIPVDFEHRSFFQPDAVAAGYIAPSSLSVGPDGINGYIEWTQQANEMVRSGDYRYLSPALAYNPRFTNGNELHVERLVGMGLTNQPNIAEMKPLVFNQRNKEEEKMLEQLAKLKSALGLPPEADDAKAVLMAVERLLQPAKPEVEEPGEPAESPKEEAAEPATEDAAKPAVAGKDGAQSPSREEFLALKKEIADLKQKQLTEQVHGAIAVGKLLPAQKDWALAYAANDPDGFRQFIANSSAVVNMGTMVPGTPRVAANAPLDPEQENINKLLGISRELHNKYNSKQ